MSILVSWEEISRFTDVSVYRCSPTTFISQKKNKKQKKNTRQYHANKELLKKKKNVVWWHVLDFNESKTLEAHYIIQGLSLT